MSETQPVDGAVVVPAVKAPSSVAILRSLGRRGVHTIAVSEHDTPPAFCSRYCDETRRVPSPSEDLPGYRDALLALARREDVRAITPMREEDAYTLARDRSTFADHVATVWPTFEQLETVHDRVQLLAAADRADVPVPETQLLDEVEDWDRDRIVKARYALLTADYGGASPDRCRTPPKTIYLSPGAEPDRDALVDAMGHVPLVQAYLTGTEYSFRALYDHGEPVATSQKRLVRGYKYPRGPSICHEAVDVPRLEEVGRALLDELDWHGVATVGFIRDDSGAFRLLEVNPRFWSQLSLDVQAGVDYPLYYWRLATEGLAEATPDYQPGLTTHLLRGELVHLHSVVREEYPLAARPSIAGTVREIARSLYEHPRFDYLSLDDPGPFVRDGLNTAGSLHARLRGSGR